MRGCQLMQVSAIVTRVEGGQSWVKPSGDSGCGRCQEQGGCRSDTLGQLFGPRCREYAADNSVGAQAGAAVTVEVPDGVPLQAAMRAYALPTLGLLLGAGLGAWVIGGDLGVLAGALPGMLIGAMALRLRGEARRRIMPRIIDLR